MSGVRRLRAVLVGLGKMGAGYADDPVMSRYFKFATHAQVLAQHPGFEWDACVDRNPAARAAAKERWGVPHVAASVDELPDGYRPDVVVIATPPEARAELIETFSGTRAFLLEKPLASSAAESRALVERCRARGALVQVCLWRRADAGLRALAAGSLQRQIGALQCLSVIYGNGLRNNGTHMIDMVRMLFGEIAEVQAFADSARAAGPLANDVNVAFRLRLADGAPATFLPVDFGDYRENGIDAWGRTGQLSIRQEGLVARVYARQPNRAMQGEWEIDGDTATPVATDPGHALYQLYDNLYAALTAAVPLWSPSESALRTEIAVDAVFASVRQDGTRITLA
jgi:predicted dehydrogenase